MSRTGELKDVRAVFSWHIGPLVRFTCIVPFVVLCSRECHNFALDWGLLKFVRQLFKLNCSQWNGWVSATLDHFCLDFTPIYSSDILMDVGSLAVFYRRHKGLLVILIFACFRWHISSFVSTVSLQASLLCLVKHTVSLVTCKNGAFRADLLHYLSDIIRRPVYLTVLFCCASNITVLKLLFRTCNDV